MARRSNQQQATRVKANSDPQGSTKLAFVTGVFIGLIAATGAFLLWPTVSAPEPYLEDVGQFAEETSQRVTETIDWSFYDLFPKAEVFSLNKPLKKGVPLGYSVKCKLKAAVCAVVALVLG